MFRENGNLSREYSLRGHDDLADQSVGSGGFEEERARETTQKETSQHRCEGGVGVS